MDDVRLVVRVLGENAVRGGGSAERRRRVASALAEAIGADAWLWVRSELPEGAHGPTALSMLHEGLSDAQVAAVLEGNYNTDAPPPENGELLRTFREQKHFTRVREDLVADEEWRGSAHYQNYRAPHGLDEYVYSIYPLGPEAFSAVGFHRGVGRPAFDARARRLVHVVMSELGALHADGATVGAVGGGKPATAGLTPRLRTVFGLLLEGWNRKQIAQRLGLSPHTVAEYMRGVYQHFKVSGQRELQARFLRGDGGDVPG